MPNQDKNREKQQHGPDQGQMPNRNRSDVQETPEQDINTEPRRGGGPNENFKDGPDGTQEGGSQAKIGGQGMGQGRGMNPGEGNASKRGQENDQRGGDRSDRAAHGGATGERSTSGGQNKSEPKNQDEKGMAHPRNK